MPTEPQDTFEILVVDDDALLQRIVARSLAGAGHQVRLAATGEEARAQVAKAPPDLLLLDVDLPDVAGTELCRELRQRHALEDLPIVMLTAHRDDAAIEAAFDAGATDFLMKPINPTLLRQRVRFALRAVGAIQRVNANERRLARGHELAGIGQFEWDEATQRIEFTPQALRILGHPALVPGSLAEWVAGYVALNDREKASALFAGAEQIDPELRLLIGGEQRTVRILVERRSTPAGTIVSATMHDISAFAGSRGHKLGRFDGVTGLPSRQLFEHRLEGALRALDGRRFAVLFVDIDDFKATNAALGQLAGDELLRVTAERLLETLRLGDSIGRMTGSAGRWGGDEFAVMIGPLAGPADAEKVGQRLLSAVSEPAQVGGKPRAMRVSVGVALAPDHGRTSFELMRAAGRALDEARRTGGNRVRVYEQVMESRAMRRALIESDLPDALGGDQLHLVYQPRFALSTLAIHSAEALLRWRHPALGMISPAEFIPVAERTRAILEIGSWALAQALRELARWREAGFAALGISVNLSPIQLQDEEFLRRLTDSLLDAQVPAHQLELEITESMMLDSSPVAVRNLAGITELGVGLSVDDFGTGYSSLSALLAVPLRAVKLDRSIVQQLGSSQSARTAVRAMVTMCRGMNSNFVAEGIETELELGVLRELGCHEGQGYWFAEPLEPEKFVERLRGARGEQLTRVAR